MPSGLYDAARQKFLSGDMDFDADDIRIVGIDAADYTVNLATHEFLDDVPSGARIGTPVALASKTVTAGVADAADATLVSVTGDQFEAALLFVHTGTDATAELVAYIDGFAAVTPNGGNITFQFDSGANRIFKL